MRYNVARKPLGKMHNAPLASDSGKELRHPILSMLAMYGVQVKIYREMKKFTKQGNKVVNHIGRA